MESTPPRDRVSVSPGSLAAAFADLPDPRRAASVAYPLPAVLALAVAAILANHLSVPAIAEWGAPGPRPPGHPRLSHGPHALSVDPPAALPPA